MSAATDGNVGVQLGGPPWRSGALTGCQPSTNLVVSRKMLFKQVKVLEIIAGNNFQLLPHELPFFEQEHQKMVLRSLTEFFSLYLFLKMNIICFMILTC